MGNETEKNFQQQPSNPTGTVDPSKKTLHKAARVRTSRIHRRRTLPRQTMLVVIGKTAPSRAKNAALPKPDKRSEGLQRTCWGPFLLQGRQCPLSPFRLPLPLAIYSPHPEGLQEIP